MSQYPLQHEWLSLIEISGPFLAANVLNEAFPQGLEGLDAQKRKRLRQAYEEWREAVDTDDPQLSELHAAWIDEVLSRTLELDENNKGDVLKRSEWCSQHLSVIVPEQGITTAPNFAVVNEQQTNKPLLLIQVYPQSVNLDLVLKQDGWTITPADKMVQFCRAQGCRLGLVTNGERWMLVDAPIGATTSFASWYARIWNQEPVTLQAFVHLLGIRRFFVGDEEQLPALFDRSLKFQDEVTDALGEQVRRAVEVLIQALDKADQDHNRELLRNTSEPELYEAALTVMMRLVFLLSAEERGLLLMGDERYEANYALSTLRMQLRIEAPEILEQRLDAWSRLLAIFRAVYGGIDHENLRLPALGGSLFDPDRFPFLEGRAKGTAWRSDPAKPLPIDNRTVLLLLDAIQMFQGRTLSYRALDVEQIGYVYEGLLERTVKRTDDITLDLGCTKNAKNPLVKLAELDSAKLDGTEKLSEFLAERSGSSANRIRNDLNKLVDDALAERLLTACQGNTDLRNRVKPYAHLLRVDPWGYPLVYPKGAFIVTSGSDRRETGTHYTPKSLTESIVTETLTPVAYVGPSQGISREQWVLKSPSELLELKICDPAMGSGAFLVQVCRWLSDRLVEAWVIAESLGNSITVDGVVLNSLEGNEPLPKDTETRIVIARRLIAERCLYGVDLNPLAVELAKLSIWLITLAKGRPFGFLDHNLRCGDSLLGIHRLDQLTELSMTPERKGERSRNLFSQNIEKVVLEAIELRERLRKMPIRDIHDVEAMAQLDSESRSRLQIPEQIADAFIGDVLVSEGNLSALENGLASLAILAGRIINGSIEETQLIALRISQTLFNDLTTERPRRRPFHWPLEFPEVFMGVRSGFDAVVGNPPFLGNRLWKRSMGETLQWQCQMVLGVSPGKIDLCVVFHRRAVDLLSADGCYGLIATSNIAEGSAIKVGLGDISKSGEIYFAKKGLPWPGTAAVVVAVVCFKKGKWQGACEADGNPCARIGSRLEPEELGSWDPKTLDQGLFSFLGVDNGAGLAFVITPDSAWFHRLNSEPDSLLRPYVTGDDITSSALIKLERWALDIGDKDIEEITSKWPEAASFLIEVVQQTRTEKLLESRPGLYKKWWQFWRNRSDSYALLRKRESCIAYSTVTKYPFPVVAPTDWIYTNQVLLIGIERDDTLAICLSSFFRSWLEKYSGGGLGQTLRLSAKESVFKFPLPEKYAATGAIEAAFRFNELVVGFSKSHQCGLTEVMNSVNTPSCSDAVVLELRQLIASIDDEVALTYGWNDLDITYDFRAFSGGSVNDPWRWAPSEEATAELMRRLTELNRQRFEQQSAAAPSQPKRGRRSKTVPTEPLYDLFAGGNA